MKEKNKERARKARRGIVYIATSDDILKAIMYSALTGFFFSTNEGIATYISRWFAGNFFFIPTKLIAAIGSALLFVLAYKAKMNTDEWREFVRDATGEDEAVEKAAQESQSD